MRFEDFACRWADPTGRIACGNAPHFFFDDDPESQFVISLKHTPSSLFPGTTKCAFLKESAPSQENPQGRSECSIYEERPATCRVFPAGLDDGGELTVPLTPEYGRGENEPAYKLCPQQWTLAELDANQTLLDIKTALKEMELFRLVAEVWNRQPRPYSAFPEFLRLTYDHRGCLGRAKAA